MDMAMNSEEIYAKGLAIGSMDIMKDEWIFRFRDERFVVRRPSLSEGKPAKFINIFSLPELRYGKVAKIEEVRQRAVRSQ
jgi:hypothetical protein